MANDSRYWTKEFITKFIEIYKSNPCLWKIRSKEYTNKNLKNDAYEKLVKLCQSIYPNANRDFVVKKIQSLRGSFRKELKKVESSKRSGSSTDDVYVPSLWYFDLLLFTKDQELPTASISNITNTEDNQILEEDYLEQDQEASVGFSEELVSTPGNKENIENTEAKKTTSSVVTPVSKKKDHFQRGKKRPNTSTETREFIELCKTALEPQKSVTDLTEFDAAGVSVAKKLQRMPPSQAIYAESLINQVLARGLFNNLSSETKLCDGSSSRPLNSYTSTGSRSSTVLSPLSYHSINISESSVGQAQYSASAASNDSQNQMNQLPQSSHDSNDTALSFYENSFSFLDKND